MAKIELGKDRFFYPTRCPVQLSGQKLKKKSITLQYLVEHGKP